MGASSVFCKARFQRLRTREEEDEAEGRVLDPERPARAPALQTGALRARHNGPGAPAPLGRGAGQNPEATAPACHARPPHTGARTEARSRGPALPGPPACCPRRRSCHPAREPLALSLAFPHPCCRPPLPAALAGRHPGTGTATAAPWTSGLGTSRVSYSTGRTLSRQGEHSAGMCQRRTPTNPRPCPAGPSVTGPHLACPTGLPGGGTNE